MTEHESPPKQHARRGELIKVVEVAVLALVAIATAWSGYQAAKWDGQQSVLYGTASTDRFEANADSTAGGQEAMLDVSVFTAWLQAMAAHNSQLAASRRPQRQIPGKSLMSDNGPLSLPPP